MKKPTYEEYIKTCSDEKKEFIDSIIKAINSRSAIVTKMVNNGRMVHAQLLRNAMYDLINNLPCEMPEE